MFGLEDCYKKSELGCQTINEQLLPVQIGARLGVFVLLVLGWADGQEGILLPRVGADLGGALLVLGCAGGRQGGLLLRVGAVLGGDLLVLGWAGVVAK